MMQRLDVLYGDYPLIHNSPWLAQLGAGYYYQGFDAGQGGEQLLNAWRHHGAQLETYRARSREVFDAVDPFSDTNLAAYAVQLRTLVGENGVKG